MKLGMLAFGAAVLVGAGYVIGKKIMEKKKLDDFYDYDGFEDVEVEFDEEDLEDVCDCEECDPDVTACVKESRIGDKLRKASMFAVGAIKTGADKLGETVNEIKTADMIKKGEQTVGAVKETGESIKTDIKRDIEDLKATVDAVKSEPKEPKEFGSAEDLFENAPDDIFNKMD